MERLIWPSSWCSKICENALNDLCLEECAVKRDCSHFRPKDIPFEDLPAFPLSDALTRQEKYTSVAFYLSKIVDHLQGKENGRHTYHPRSLGVFKALQSQSLLHGQEEPDPAPSDTEKCADQESGS